MKFNHKIPRVQLISDYPNCAFPVGRIFELKDKECENYYHAYTEKEPIHIDQDFIYKFNHLFKKLEWFEERNSEDLPDFVDYGWGDRRKVKINKEAEKTDYDWGFTYYKSDRQYLCHAIPIWD